MNESAMETQDCQERSLEQISEVLELAKLSENDILPVSQAIYFTENNLHDNNYKFLELDKHLLECITEGQTLFLRGEDDEDAVLCSDSKTYDLVETETSNSLLLVQGLKFSEELKSLNDRGVSKVTVSGIFYNYLEPVISKPRLRKLNTLLEKGLYKGPEHEYSVKEEDLYSYEDLVGLVQASEKELQSSLKTMNVVTINNKIRLLEFEYHFRVLSYMLKLIDENSWRLDEINYETTINSLSDLVPEAIVNSLFDLYTEESKTVDSEQLFRYNETMVCRFFAQVLLQSAGRFSLEEFLKAWSESVPEGMVTKEEMLHGVALIDLKSMPKSIRHYPEENLPETISERFKVLFEAKEKWTVPEIAPYIQRLATDKLNVNALLAKHARASTINGVKHYSAKHAK